MKESRKYGFPKKPPVTMLVVIAVAVSAAVLYYLVDPLESRIMPKCLFHTVTGLQCPGCGSQRAIHALLHGDFVAAWHHNALLMIMLPVILLMAYAEFNRRANPLLYLRLNSRFAIITFSVLIVGWGIIRNFFIIA